jgi:hypothetical protein
MVSKVLSVLILVSVSFTSFIGYSQCGIKEAHELDNFQRTDKRIADDVTKIVESTWQQSSSKFEFRLLLYYQKINRLYDQLGINKGTISFSITNIGNVHNGVIFYSDGSFETIVPFSVEWKKDDLKFPTKFSFTLKGDVIGTEDKITESNISNSPRDPSWIKDSIDLSKMPTKIVLLTDKGSKEYVITTTDYLNMQCILNRYKTPHEEDVR